MARLTNDPQSESYERMLTADLDPTTDPNYEPPMHGALWMGDPNTHVPDELPCFVCHRETGGSITDPDDQMPRRKVLRENDPPMNAADPTCSYDLACGHTII